MPRPKKPGSPPKYTKERADRFVAAIGLGATYRAASAAAGVSEDTTARWRDSMAGFASAIREAEQLREIGWLNGIRKAADRGAWQAHAWMLERTNFNTYGRKQRIDGDVGVAVSGGLSLSHKLDGLTIEQLERLAEPES